MSRPGGRVGRLRKMLAEALAYAVDPDGNPNTDDGADVINMSIATPRRTNLLSSILKRACNDGNDVDDDKDPPIL